MNKFNDPKIKRVDVHIEEMNEFTSKFNLGYGADFYEITSEHIKALQDGKVLSFDSQGEYGVYIKLKQFKPD